MTSKTRLKLCIIVASTRPTRVGLTVAHWFQRAAGEHGAFEIDFADLVEVGLPLLDEAAHPRLRRYEREHTKRWSARVEEADAFAVVTPEYNFFAPPALINALDYVYVEWNYKPMAFVSYGGMSGGIRAVQSLKPLVTTLKVVPLVEAVAIPYVSKQIGDGVFEPTQAQSQSAKEVLDELERWAAALGPLRAKTAQGV